MKVSCERSNLLFKFRIIWSPIVGCCCRAARIFGCADPSIAVGFFIFASFSFLLFSHIHKLCSVALVHGGEEGRRQGSPVVSGAAGLGKRRGDVVQNDDKF